MSGEQRCSLRPRGPGSAHLGGVGGQHVQLVHGQAQLAQIDVEVDHHVPRHWRAEHFLQETEESH